nr:hypothetical protein [Tanacetum cinerariifolium]
MDKIICDLNKTLDLSQRPPQSCPKCGNQIDGHYCQGCALLRKKFNEDLFTYCIENRILQNASEPSNDNTNIFNALQEPFVVKQDPGENSSQSPSQINHHCCYGCGDPLEDIFCHQCAYELCGKDGNSFTYDSKSNLVDDSSNVFNPPPQPPTYSYEFCWNDAYYGHNCSLQVPFTYDPEPCYNQDFNFSQNFQIFQRQYLCCTRCGGPHETCQCDQLFFDEPYCEKYGGPHMSFQCQPMNQNHYEPNPCYDSNSFGFDQFQPSQFLVIYRTIHEKTCAELLTEEHEASIKTQAFKYSVFPQPPQEEISVLSLAWETILEIKLAFEDKHCQPKDILELFRRLHNDVQNIHEELAVYINTLSWDCPTVCYNDDDEDCNIAITPKEPDNSLSMGDEHLDTIPATKSDEFIKSSVENLVLNPSESLGEHECDVPACEDFTTFFNPFFDVDDDFSSSDDQSFYDEDILKEIYLNPLFDEEIISMKIDPHHFNAEFDLIESLLNHDSSIISSSSKIDSFLDEFVDELTLLKSIPSGIDETNCDPEEETRLIKRLLYDNSSPRPPEEFISKNSDTAIESFSPSPIPVEDNASFMEEIDLSFTPDDPMPPGIKEDDYDSKRDILIFEELLSNDSLSLLENESFHFNIPSSSRPPAKPSDDNLGILNVKVMGDISKHKGHKASQPSTESSMMIYGRNTPILDDKLLVPKPPKNCARCTRCGYLVDGPHCQGCALLRQELEGNLVTYSPDFQNSSEPSNASTNVVNAPRDPNVAKQDNGSFVDKIIFSAPDSPDQFHCFHYKDVLRAEETCKRCTCAKCGSGLGKGLCYICGHNQNSLNDSSSISETSSQSPPNINHCCYECGDPLDGIFCKRCPCKSCGKDAHIGYNCPSTVPVISNQEPCNNQTIDELP